MDREHIAFLKARKNEFQQLHHESKTHTPVPQKKLSRQEAIEENF